MSSVALVQRSVKCMAIWLLTLSLACASHQGAIHEKCGLRSGDSAFAATGAVFRDCAVDQAVRLSNTSVRPDLSSLPARAACTFVELEFVVDSTGKPEPRTARVARSNDRAFADAWLAIVDQWRYEPARRAGVSVRQIVTEHRSAPGTVSGPTDVLLPKGSPPPASRPTTTKVTC